MRPDRFSRNRLFWGAVIVAGLIVAMAVVATWIALLSPPENELGLRGGLRIKVESDVRVYVGEELVGDGPLELPWDRILGSPGEMGLAIPIDPKTASPHIESIGGITAKSLAGDGAQIVWTDDSMSGSSQIVEPTRFAFKDVLIRRADGTLDHTYVLDAAFPRSRGRWKRFLLPIRLRSGKDDDAYFADPKSMGVGADQGGLLPGSRFDEKLWFSVDFRRGSAPDEFAEEIASDGLWNPRE